jgi:post-segregation antitoxin (ccd killing protein)
MPRAETKIVRVNAVADEQLVKAARRLGVSKAAMLAGLATWLDAWSVLGLPPALRKAINEAERDAVERWAEGARRGAGIRGEQIRENGHTYTKP